MSDNNVLPPLPRKTSKIVRIGEQQKKDSLLAITDGGEKSVGSSSSSSSSSASSSDQKKQSIKTKKDFIRSFQQLRSTDCIPAMFESFEEGAVDPMLLEGVDGVALVPDCINGNGHLVSLEMPPDDYDEDEELFAESPKSKKMKT